MDDARIVELYWQRDEAAITETQTKYGHYCYCIAYNILKNNEDAKECENNTYLDAWNSMPPNKPAILSSFLGMITRRISLDKFRKSISKKRGGGEAELSLDELEWCVPSDKSIDDEMDAENLAKLISSFLKDLPKTECNVFLRRYWHFDSIKDISKRYGYTQSKVKMMLKRTREKLANYLEKEGVFI